MRAAAVARAGVLPASPVYHIIVLLLVPAVSVVACVNGTVGGLATTRIGGLAASTLKNSSAALIAEAAESDVAASLPTEVVSAACRLAVVAVGLAPMVNWFSPGGDSVVAVSVRSSVVPSGSANENFTVWPAAAWLARRLPDRAAGGPVGRVVAEPARVEETAPGWRPNTDGATSSRTDTELVGAAVVAAGPKVAGGALPPMLMAS